MLFTFKGSQDYKEGGDEGWDEEHRSEELLSEGQCPMSVYFYALDLHERAD